MIHDYEAKTIDGQPKKLSDYRGKVLLIVNTASECGYTPQYAGLQALYEKYAAKGFEVLAFPANEFGAQEPGTDAQIKAFCSTKFRTTFPLFSKVVVKGPGIHPLYSYLTMKSPFPGEVPWNFAKFLVGKDGAVKARFTPDDEPLSETVTSKVEELLKG
ncbi:MAG: glutathione peroxidase [Elusimicrobia bacterium]|nr:glutathione peroxidase [Elusimicrobiota bacterium]